MFPCVKIGLKMREKEKSKICTLQIEVYSRIYSEINVDYLWPQLIFFIVVFFHFFFTERMHNSSIRSIESMSSICEIVWRIYFGWWSGMCVRAYD